MEKDSIALMVAELDKRLALVEKTVDGAAPRPWVELFVREIVQPIRDSIATIEHSITELSKDGQELYAAFNESIKKEEARKDKEARDKTLSATVIRWGALAAAISGIVLLFRIGGTLLELWLKAKGFNQ